MEGYTGEGEPPCVVMALRADSDMVRPSDLSLTVTLNGVSGPNKIQIEQSAGESVLLSLKYSFKLIKFLY